MTLLLRRPLAAALPLLALALAVACNGAAPPGNAGGCPASTIACGNGCIPVNGVCCDEGSVSGSSYCTNGASTCTLNSAGTCSAAFGGSSAVYCCSGNSSIGSNDCPAGEQHCGLLCQAYACTSGSGGSSGSSSGAGGGDDGGGGVATATFVGATYNTELGKATGMASGCTYDFSATGTLTLAVVGDGSSGNATGTMTLNVALSSPSPTPGVPCTEQTYSVNQSSNAVSGSYSALSATTSDGSAFNVTQFAGSLSGNTLVGTLTLDVTTGDLDGGGSYVTFPPVVISGYVLTKQ